MLGVRLVTVSLLIHCLISCTESVNSWVYLDASPFHLSCKLGQFWSSPREKKKSQQPHFCPSWVWGLPSNTESPFLQLWFGEHPNNVFVMLKTHYTFYFSTHIETRNRKENQFEFVLLADCILFLSVCFRGSNKETIVSFQSTSCFC